MLWKGRRQSSNIEDRRGMGGGMGGGMRFPGGLGGGMGGGGMRRGGGMGIFGILILLGVCWLLGINPLALLSGDLGTGGGGYVEQPQQSAGGGTFASPQEEELKEFVATVLAETEDTWNTILPQIGEQYREPKLVLFSGGAQSGCGFAQSAVGPFYCPADEKVYIDLSFFDELSRRFGAPGDFAQAYVIAHEVGHHVQTVLGIEEQVRQARANMSESEGNALSVRVELQADCFSGVWAQRRSPGARAARTGRYRGSARRRQRGRRRHAAEAGRRPRGARQLHPRLIGTAHALVRDRLSQRQHRGLRYVSVIRDQMPDVRCNEHHSDIWHLTSDL